VVIQPTHNPKIKGYNHEPEALFLVVCVGNCDALMKQKILVINKTKRDKILLKPKVYDQGNLRGIL
jgi:hypothetical protein